MSGERNVSSTGCCLYRFAGTVRTRWAWYSFVWSSAPYWARWANASDPSWTFSRSPTKWCKRSWPEWFGKRTRLTENTAGTRLASNPSSSPRTKHPVTCLVVVVQVHADRGGQRHMRQDHHHRRSRHHVGPAQFVHRYHRRRVPLLSARRPPARVFLRLETIPVAVLRVARARARHRFRHGVQVRRL